MLDTCKTCNNEFQSPSKYIHFCQRCRYQQAKKRVEQSGKCKKCETNYPEQGYKYCTDCKIKLNKYNTHYTLSKKNIDVRTLNCSTKDCSNHRFNMRTTLCLECFCELPCNKCGINSRTRNGWCLDCKRRSRQKRNKNLVISGICIRCGINKTSGKLRCNDCSLHEESLRRARRKQRKLDVIKVLGWGLRCMRCSFETNNAELLQFHHIDSTTKKDTISQLLSQANLEKAIEEARKCQLLCARCHTEKHQEDLDNKYK